MSLSQDSQEPQAGHAPAPSPSDLLGRTAPWLRWELGLLGLIVLAAWAFRLWHLGAEGFGDDEVHKWLAAGRYLHGDFSGDDVEHPMLMKALIAVVRVLLEPRGVLPETITRLPNAVSGGVAVGVVALLGRRLFGKTAGLVAAALAAVSTTLIGYHRVAKEDTLLGLFLLLLCWCLAEAKAAADDGRAAEQRRWELWGALSITGMMASKYFPWLVLLAPLFVWSQRGSSAFRVPLKRWAQLIGLAFAAWIAVNWSPFLPSTWVYAQSYTTGQQTVHGSLYFMGKVFHNLVEYGWNGTPLWFYAVFTAVKLSPLTFGLAMAGLLLALLERRPAHKLLFSWLGVWFAIHSLSGSKWGRFYTSVQPAFLLLAAYALVRVVERVRAKNPPLAGATLAGLLFLSVGGEAAAALQHAPHYRLYISPLGGGDAQVSWYFPHCDDFDAGFREAVAWVAAHAEPGAELTTEIDWPAKLYAERYGHMDLVHTVTRKGKACRQGRTCYAITQRGRRYFINEEALETLATKTPVHTEQLLGQDVVKVYRLPPGESPFASENAPK